MGVLKHASIALLFVFAICSALPAVSAASLWYYPGPDTSADYMELTEFRVEGPPVPMVGDSLTVSFTLTYKPPPGQPGGITLGPKGIYAAVRDADGTNRDFGTKYAGQSIAPSTVLTFSASITVDEVGTWEVWPSYQINLPTGVKVGPDHWHSGSIPVAAPQRPDLVVLDVVADPANSRVGFMVANNGNATASSSFSVRLLVGQQAFFETVPQGLAAGAQYSSWFSGYAWPENTNITATVTADFYNVVAEFNEGNNALTESLARQAEELRITEGPSVEVMDQDTVIVRWLTNLNSNSSVSYGTTSLPDRSQGNSTQAKSHYVTLDKLEAGTTYSFSVASWDSLGQRAGSKPATFETLPPSDGKAPSLLVPIAGNLSGVVDVVAQAEDEGGVDRLLFFMDGVLAFTDYSPPFSWRLDTTEYQDGSCNITVLAIDRAGNPTTRMVAPFIDNPEGDERPPVVSILSPWSGEVVWGSVRIEAFIQDLGLVGETTGYIQKAEILVDGASVKTWVYIPFRLNPVTGETDVYPRSSNLTLVHYWDTSALAQGSNHTVEVRAWDNSSNVGSSSVNVTKVKVEAATPPLELKIAKAELSRTVVRHGNWFEVTLSLTNVGNVNLSGLWLEDICVGFQIISLPMPATSPDRVSYEPVTKTSKIIFTNPEGELPSGETWTVSYYAVPILFDYWEGYEDSMYQIGARALISASTPVYFEIIDTPYAPALENDDFDMYSDLQDSFKSADYLIVTNPSRLFALNSWDKEGVNLLLQDAATLAKAKNGVLGYTSTIDKAHELKLLIIPGGEWAEQLGECFSHPHSQNAFLLLIGETEVLPAHNFDIHAWDFNWESGDDLNVCRLSDHYYADPGLFGRPDLMVGRIIGNTARELLLPIEASLEVFMGHGTSRDRAVVVSGYEDNSGDRMVECMLNAGGDLMAQGFTVGEVHFSILLETAWAVHFDEDDVFMLADVDHDGLDEAVIGRDEEDMVYIYECYPRSLVGSFSCPITPNDGFTAGDYDGDGKDEIAIAHNGDGQGGRIYIYEANGTRTGDWEKPFGEWDLIGSGDLYDVYGERSARDEVVIARCDTDSAYAYSLSFDEGTGQYSLVEGHFSLGIDLTHYDAMAVGNLRDDLEEDEVAIVRDDNSHGYVYDVYGAYGIDGVNRMDLRDSEGDNIVKYSRYDGVAAGDVNNDTEDELVILCDDCDKMFAYHWEDGQWKWYPLYSQFWDDWFNGVYYTGGNERHDGFGIGRLNLTEPALMVVLLNNFGDASNFLAFAASWPEAEGYANERIEEPSRDISILTVLGHGNPDGASPMGVPYSIYWNFANHPLVFAFSCEAGLYDEGDDYNFGDALFGRGAAVFIGSTEISAKVVNNDISRRFFQDDWDIGSELPAIALRDLKRDIWGGVYSKLWVIEYNFYGDPKFGG